MSKIPDLFPVESELSPELASFPSTLSTEIFDSVDWCEEGKGDIRIDRRLLLVPCGFPSASAAASVLAFARNLGFETKNSIEEVSNLDLCSCSADALSAHVVILCYDRSSFSPEILSFVRSHPREYSFVCDLWLMDVAWSKRMVPLYDPLYRPRFSRSSPEIPSDLNLCIAYKGIKDDMSIRRIAACCAFLGITFIGSYRKSAPVTHVIYHGQEKKGFFEKYNFFGKNVEKSFAVVDIGWILDAWCFSGLPKTEKYTQYDSLAHDLILKHLRRCQLWERSRLVGRTSWLDQKRCFRVEHFDRLFEFPEEDLFDLLDQFAVEDECVRDGLPRFDSEERCCSSMEIDMKQVDGEGINIAFDIQLSSDPNLASSVDSASGLFHSEEEHGIDPLCARKRMLERRDNRASPIYSPPPKRSQMQDRRDSLRLVASESEQSEASAWRESPSKNGAHDTKMSSIGSPIYPSTFHSEGDMKKEKPKQLASTKTKQTTLFFSPKLEKDVS